MDKRLIQPLEGYMAIPEIVKTLGLSRARIHQLVEEDRFDVEDLRVVGDKRLIIIRNAAVYKQLHVQQERADRIAADRAAEEQRIVARMAVKAAEHATQDGRLAEENAAAAAKGEQASSEVIADNEDSQV